MKRSLLAIVLSVTALSPLEGQETSPPKRPMGVPPDAQLFNGKWFRVYLEKASWQRAKEKCVALGGRLAVVPDAATWDFVKKLSMASLWLGATDEQNEGAWKWVDGTAVTFGAWVLTNPNNIDGKEHYLAMVFHEQKQGWNDFAKDGRSKNLEVTGFVCEWQSKAK